MADRPIFIVGSGRSGTTLLYQLMCRHPELAWISNASNRLPALPGSIFFNRFFPDSRLFKPADEAIHAWARCGIRAEDIHPAQVPQPASLATPVLRRKAQRLINRHQRGMGRPRFVSKNTSNSMRIPLLNELFPDALFVHIRRHPYGVIHSLMYVEFWLDLPLWWKNGRTPAQLQSHGAHPCAIAAEHWSHQVQAVLDSRNAVDPERFIEISYEELVLETETTLQRVLHGCGLAAPASYLDVVDEYGVQRKSLEGWRRGPVASARAEVDAVVAELCAELDYPLNL